MGQDLYPIYVYMPSKNNTIRINNMQTTSGRRVQELNVCTVRPYPDIHSIVHPTCTQGDPYWNVSPLFFAAC